MSAIGNDGGGSFLECSCLKLGFDTVGGVLVERLKMRGMHVLVGRPLSVSGLAPQRFNAWMHGNASQDGFGLEPLTTVHVC